ncbi:MAG: bifunctional [glutamate--ammonia ligase]-adenylyl-L-tyrosine phosphorylase/[glutamate--ammonia-ligase] adenylyltransferase [Mariprofundaceae bacterium]|nr:bifunctional [glutamate--ammonia ligase]-adenylyl-L-tyrosine phosphorylase/[glutamate--ammonia-ligase] adenylyltransferase [Mariprofundaceae bacterium]
MNNTFFENIAAPLQSDAQRLLDISPLFKSLMRTADKHDWQQVFQDKEYALLPDASAQWQPHLDSADINACMTHLRSLKQRAMRHIIWWEQGVHGDIEASYQSITYVAEGLLQQAVTMAKDLIAPRFGRLNGGSFCVIGLGKLGGGELNLGSDVDPLFIWQGHGHTEGGRKSIPAKEYYNHLARMLIRLMAEYTEYGMVWPVDMRLRPGGDGAAICLNLDATLSHYLEYAQTWERAMLIKARPVAGDMALGKAFLKGVAPFVYRRYLDYSSVAALADMKRRIDLQAGSAVIAAGFDVKRGRGGIREIEFIIQSMQLLHGGRDDSLRQYEGKAALDVLQKKGFMEADEAKKLFDAYCFWRRIEHAIQARNGEQTHILPADYEDYLSQALGMEDATACMQQQSNDVAAIFSERVLPVSQQETHQKTWLVKGSLNDTDKLNDADRHAMQQALQQIDAQLLRGLLPERSRQQLEIILDVAMPCWLDDANGLQAVRAFADLLHTIAGRATWVDLLATHPGALHWFIGVLSASRYLAEHIVKNPSWLEWPLANERGEVEVQRVCADIAQLTGAEDEDAFLAELGRCIDYARVQCALAVDAHAVESMAMGAWLADVADAAVRACLRSCLHQLKLPQDFPLVALALGKHGSREMGLVSDLDMVFILAGDPHIQIHGRSTREWAQRLGRRMIRQLTGKPPFGADYAFDARLRPSGNSGVLVTSLHGFEDYQSHEAQTWEHQALCRARAVTGGEAVRADVRAVVQAVLKMPRDVKKLAAEVFEMRQKMLEHLSNKHELQLNLKHDAGGLVDIEFLAQFACLAFATQKAGCYSTVQSLLMLPDNVPKIWHDASVFLAQTYITYRQMENTLRVELWQSIGQLSSDDQAPEWETMRRHTSMPSPQILQQTMQKVHTLFHQLLT